MPGPGQCHCGSVKFEVTGKPFRMAQCHCEACRRSSGTGHTSQAFFKKDQITITGDTNTHQSEADSGSTRTRHFCPECGSRLFSENTRLPEVMGIAVGVFDNSDWFQPETIVYCSERPIWDFVDPSVEQHEVM